MIAGFLEIVFVMAAGTDIGARVVNRLRHLPVYRGLDMKLVVLERGWEHSPEYERGDQDDEKYGHYPHQCIGQFGNQMLHSHSFDVIPRVGISHKIPVVPARWIDDDAVREAKSTFRRDVCIMRSFGSATSR